MAFSLFTENYEDDNDNGECWALLLVDNIAAFMVGGKLLCDQHQ